MYEKPPSYNKNFGKMAPDQTKKEDINKCGKTYCTELYMKHNLHAVLFKHTGIVISTVVHMAHTLNSTNRNKNKFSQTTTHGINVRMSKRKKITTQR